MDNLSLLKLFGEALAKAKSNNSEKKADNSGLGLEKFAQLFQSISNKNPQASSQTNNQKQDEKPKENQQINSPPMPLQSQMLGTMKNHDDFIKRVLEKNTPN